MGISQQFEQFTKKCSFNRILKCTKYLKQNIKVSVHNFNNIGLEFYHREKIIFYLHFSEFESGTKLLV